MSPFIAFLFPFFTLIVSSAVFYNLLSCNSMTLVTTYFQQWSKPAFAVAMCIYILPSSIIVYNVLAFFPFCPPFFLVSYTFYIHFIVRCFTVIFQSELLCSLAFKLVSFPVSMFLLSQIFLFVKSPKCCSSLFLSPSIPFCWTCRSLFGGSTRTTLDDVGRRRTLSDVVGRWRAMSDRGRTTSDDAGRCRTLFDDVGRLRTISGDLGWSRRISDDLGWSRMMSDDHQMMACAWWFRMNSQDFWWFMMIFVCV